MLKAFIVAILLAFFSNVYSQHATNISSLIQELKQAKADTDKVDIYALLCYNYCTVNTDSALFYGNIAMQLANKINYAKGIGNAYNDLGWAYCSKGDNVQGKKFLTEAFERFQKLDDKYDVAVTLGNLGNVYVSESNYPAALSSFYKAFEYFEDTKEDSHAAEMLFSMGRIYNLEKNPVKARSYFQQAYAIHKKEGDELYMAQALASIANTYQLQNQFDTALDYYKKVIPVFLRYDDMYRTGNAYENIADAYEGKNQLDKALSNMQQAEKYYQQVNAKPDMAYAYYGLGNIYATAGETDKSIENYKKALQLASENTDYDLQQTVMAGLSDMYLKKDDYKNAYLLLDSSHKIKDSLFTKDKQDELLKLQTEFETERKEKENQRLKTQNLAASLKLEHNKVWLITTTAALLIAGVLLYALYKNRQSKIKNIKNLKQLNLKLEEQKEEISRINNILELKALRAQMNPHFIFNCMSSIQECILLGRIDDANTYLTKLSRLLRMVLNYSDEESISLDKELQMLTLYLELEKIRLKNNFEYTIELNEEIIPEELQVPALILQPFAENAIWHGLVNKKNNRHLSILGNIENDVLHFTITDNGIGRAKAEELKAQAKKHQSKGIALIEKRLCIINKKANNRDAGFSIRDLYNDDSTAAGTSVEIRLPLIVT